MLTFLLPVYVCMHSDHSVRVELREELVRMGSLLLLHRSWGIKLRSPRLAASTYSLTQLTSLYVLLYHLILLHRIYFHNSLTPL